MQCVRHEFYITLSLTLFWQRQLRVGPALGAHPICCRMDTGGSFHRSKAAVCENGISPQSSGEVKNAWSSTSPYVLMYLYLIKHRTTLHLPFT
jgi:hypothetical protein